ncbi:hypothetical protein [Flagellimonas aurea]|uniref:hypothetical protein n=1 Tax=Flagellimonas aurea TaxID=2915619 RepID=UPI0035D053FC
MATGTALLTIATFFGFSFAAEIIGQVEFIKKVKTGIVRALPILVLAMPVLGITGKKLSGNSKDPVIVLKMRRMKIVAINGILLILLALYLYYSSLKGDIDIIFFSFQVLELCLGAINLWLIVLNIRSGLNLKQHRKSEDW